MSKLEVRHSVAVGDIGIVWVPDAETEFLAPGGGTTTGEALASLFTPATWATWLQEQGRGVPYEVPELRWFLAEHDVFQRSASRGRPSICGQARLCSPPARPPDHCHRRELERRSPGTP